ncbi:MAG: DUF6240 domain-containing protein [Lachnospiraceae bacterium]|nr:DUF6240 domain-containing protein [Lachnospiraceae bacterium]
MRIDFSQTDIKKEEQYPKISGSDKQGHVNVSDFRASGVFTEIGKNALDDIHAYSKKRRTAADELEKAENYDEKLQRNFMAVMGNTMSGKDFKEMVENGYSPGQMQVKDAVNSLDRMKVKLAEAGVQVAGYTDTVSAAKASEITGSVTRAAKITSDVPKTGPDTGEVMVPDDAGIEKELKNADLPVTEENVKDIKKAFEIASMLKEPTDAAVGFMVENAMEPTISNLYEAQFSTGNAASSRHPGYFYDEDLPYLAAAGSGSIENANDTIREQILDVIKDAGFEDDEETVKDAGQLIAEGIPLTKESLRLYKDIRSIDLNPDIREMSLAIADGKRPKDAYLYRNYRNVKAERQLKETELAMTSEANRKLVRSDYSIDTGKLENEVEELKNSEKELFDLLEEAITVVRDIEKAPAELIGETAFFGFEGTRFFEGITEGENLTLSDLHREGAALKDRYEKMNLTYEAVGTQVRPDLGDSIKKAFGNADELIRETGLEINEENRRAVRILGYSRMEIDEENIERVKEADAKINDMIKLLTPKNVLRLIRENINPLQHDTDSIIGKLSEYQDEDEGGQRDFAKYLVKIRDKGEITEKEAASYIGIYRLIDKITKSDGAAVGALLNSDSALTMKNLLSSFRTSRHGHMDYIIDDEFGGLERVDDETILKIDTQIETAFSDEYYEEEAKKFADAAHEEERIYRLLDRNGIETTADNINAAAALLGSGGTFLKKLFEGEKDKSESRLKEARNNVIKRMGEPEEFSEAYEEMINEEIIAAFEGEKLDIRILQSGHRVTAVQKTLSETENYQVPVEINGELTSINLQIRHGEKRGNVDILFESETLGRVAASFSLTKTAAEGIVTCSQKTGFDYINSNKNRIEDLLSFNERTVTMEVIRTDRTSFEPSVNATEGEEIETRELYLTARAFIGGFIYEDQQ